MPQRNDAAIWSGLFRISAESGQTLAGADPPGDRRRHPRPPDRGLDAAAVLPHPGREARRCARHRGAGLPATRRPGLSDRARAARPFRQSGGAGNAGQAAPARPADNANEIDWKALRQIAASDMPRAGQARATGSSRPIPSSTASSTRRCSRPPNGANATAWRWPCWRSATGRPTWSTATTRC